MKKCTLRITLVVLILWPVRCAPFRKKSETTLTFHRTGEAIAFDNLIKIYEKEHQNLYQEKNDGSNLKWSTLDTKNLSEYCRKYLQQVVPTRSVHGAMGTQINRKLYYRNHNITTTGEVVIILCKVMCKSCPVAYYVTRALEPNCAYALKCTGTRAKFIYTIINKYCDFENKPFNRTTKWKYEEFMSMTHRTTGQLIAKNEYLIKYEMEHQKLFRKEGGRGKHIQWPHAMMHPNLNSYCYWFVGECAPKRRREDVRGSWSIEILYYQKLNPITAISVTTVTCLSFRWYYYMTRATEVNCVFALLRNSRGSGTRFVIAFKYCDFEHPIEQKITTKNYSILDTYVIPKMEVKE